MSRLMIIGCGGVASVAIHKCCQNSEVFTDIMIASRTKSKCDALKEKLQETYDYVFLCGVFNAKTTIEFMEQMLIEAFFYCEKGLAFNFISDYVNFKTEEFSYHNPQEIFTFCVENLSRKVELHHHYAKCDVSIFVYKE